MSGQGKLTTGGYTQFDQEDSIAPLVGKVALQFEHQASQGDTEIDFSSLNPTPEYAARGYVQPTTNDIISAQLGLLRNNVVIHSSYRGLVRPAEVFIGNSTIQFKDFTAVENEIFTVRVGDVVRSGNVILADVQPLNVKATLLEDQTDIALGQEIDVNTQLNVHRGTPKLSKMLQNTDNSSTVLDEDYYIVENTPGKGSILRFNVAGDVGGEPVTVEGYSTNYVTNDQSVLQQLDVLAGKVDIIGDEVEVISGVPLGLGTPSRPDLTAFGNRVTVLEQLLNAQVPKRWSTIIDLAGQGDFSSGRIRVTRLGDDVTIIALENLVHSSNAQPTAGVVLPTWARPLVNQKTNVYFFDSTTVRRINCDPDGTVRFAYNNSSFTLTALTGTGSGLTASYSIDDGQGFQTLAQQLGI